MWFGIILPALGIHHASELTVKRYDAEVAKDGGGRESLRVCSSRICIWDTASARNASRTWSKMSTRRTRISFSSRAISLITPWTEIDDPESVKASLRSMKSRLGVYACWGNHDVAERLFSGFSTKKLENTQHSRADGAVCA